MTIFKINKDRQMWRKLYHCLSLSMATLFLIMGLMLVLREIVVAIRPLMLVAGMVGLLLMISMYWFLNRCNVIQSSRYPIAHSNHRHLLIINPLARNHSPHQFTDYQIILFSLVGTCFIFFIPKTCPSSNKSNYQSLESST